MNSWINEVNEHLKSVLGCTIPYFPNENRVLTGKQGIKPVEKDFKDNTLIYVNAWREYSHKGKIYLYPIVSGNCFKNNYGSIPVFNGLDVLKRELSIYDGLSLDPVVSQPAKNKPQKTPVSDNAFKTKEAFNAVETAFLNGVSANHAYLVKKGLTHYSRLFKSANFSLYGISDNWLIIPLTDIEGNIKAYQCIGEKSGKKFFIGSVKGLFVAIGNQDAPKTIYFCEGIATALSVHNGDNDRFVIACMDAGGLLPVSTLFAEKYQDSCFIFCADNDVRTADKLTVGNTGLYTALSAINTLKKNAVCSLSPTIDGLKTDWNDYELINGKITDKVIKDNVISLNLLDTYDSLKGVTSISEAVSLASQLYGVVPKRKYKDISNTLIKKFPLFDKASLEHLKTNFPPLFELVNVATDKQLKQATSRAKRNETAFNQCEIIKSDSEYLPDIKFICGKVGKPNVYAIKAPIGSGKTTQIKDFIDSLPNNIKVLAITPRKVLASALAKDFKLEDYQGLKPNEYINPHRLSIVINSVSHLEGNVYNIIVLDEIEQILRQITQSIIKNKRAVLSVLIELLRSADTIICADAQLSNTSIEFLIKHLQSIIDKPVLYLNENKRFSGRSMNYCYDSSVLIMKFLEAVRTGKKVYFATNTLKTSYVLNEVLNNLVEQIDNEQEKNEVQNQLNQHTDLINKLRIKIINSDTSHENENIDFIANFDKAVRDYDVLIASPSITSGISNHTKHFDVTLGYFSVNKNLPTPNDCLQQLGRVRYDTEMYVYVKNKLLNLETDKRNIFNNSSEKIKDTVFINELGETTLNHAYTDLYMQVTSCENSLKNNYLLSFLALAKLDGYNFNVIDSVCNDSKQIEKTAKKINKQTEINGVINAKQLNDEEYFKLKDKQGITRAERWEIERYKLAEFYNATDNDKLAESINFDKNGRGTTYIDNLITLNTPDNVLREIDKLAFINAQNKWTEPHYKPLSTIKLLMQTVSGAYGTTPETAVTADSEQVKTALNAIEQNSKLFNAMGYRVTIKDLSNPMRLLGNIAKKLGFNVGSTKKRISNKTVNAYFIKQDDNDYINGVIAYQTAKRIDHITSHLEHLREIVFIPVADTAPPVSCLSTNESDSIQKPDPHLTSSYIENEEKCGSGLTALTNLFNNYRVDLSRIKEFFTAISAVSEDLNPFINVNFMLSAGNSIDDCLDWLHSVAT